MYAAVNQLFGDIVKVTPTSKVVGDAALFLLSHNLTPADVLDPKRDVSFPESVVEFFEGKLGQPPGGFPKELQAKVLRSTLADATLEASIIAALNTWRFPTASRGTTEVHYTLSLP